MLSTPNVKSAGSCRPSGTEVGSTTLRVNEDSDISKVFTKFEVVAGFVISVEKFPKSPKGPGGLKKAKLKKGLFQVAVPEKPVKGP